MDELTAVRLIGKVLVRADIRVVTGLRIGGSAGGLKIGGLDDPIIRDAWDRPYIPGSSLRGKLRNLLERELGLPVPVGETGLHEHKCRDVKDYSKCPVCRMFGLTLKQPLGTMTLTRLQVRDIYLDATSLTMLPAVEPATLSEVKIEIMIDRRTGTTGKKGTGGFRQIERVPAGAVFRPAEFIFNIYEEGDKDLLRCLFVAMELLEDDYLGGMGSRGYGKVKFENIEVFWNTDEDYRAGKVGLTAKKPVNGENKTPQALVHGFSELRNELGQQGSPPQAGGDPSPCSG